MINKKKKKIIRKFKAISTKLKKNPNEKTKLFVNTSLPQKHAAGVFKRVVACHGGRYICKVRMHGVDHRGWTSGASMEISPYLSTTAAAAARLSKDCWIVGFVR